MSAVPSGRFRREILLGAKLFTGHGIAATPEIAQRLTMP
jgi:hypothetical protein